MTRKQKAPETTAPRLPPNVAARCPALPSSRPANPPPKVKTSTLEATVRPALTRAASTPITSLHFFDRRLPPLSMPPEKKRFSIGAGACDLIIARTISNAVSGFHATLDRIGPELSVTDHSKNGTYPSRGTDRREVFTLQAGESFWLGDIHLLAADEQLDRLRPPLAACVGLARDAEINDALRMVASSLQRALALVGPLGSGAHRLAEAIHCTSPRRNNVFMSIAAAPLPSLEHAYGGTVFFDLDAVKKLPAPYVKTLLDSARCMRAIFGATTERVLRAKLDHYLDIDLIKLRPLAARPEDILQLVANHWIDELRTPRRPEELPGVHHINEHDWPRNLDELYEVSTRLHTYLMHNGLRPAAAALGISHQTLSKYLRRVHFFPQDRVYAPYQRDGEP